jgi:AraC-like DNA-binding protein
MPYRRPHFARLSGLGPLPRLLEERAGGRALARLLDETGLRLDGLAPATPVPFANLNEAFNRAGRLSGDPLFSLRVAQAMTPEDYGPFAVFALQGPTLWHAIGRISRLSTLQNSINRFMLSDDGHYARWALDYVDVRGFRVEHHALHVLVPMVSVIQRYAGTEARPSALHLAVDSNPSFRVLEQALGVPIRTGEDTFSIVFPSEWLRLKHAGEMTALTLADTLAHYRREALPRSMSETVAALIAPAVGDTETDLDAVAARLAVGRRTLQQRLNSEGTSFRDISLRVRIARAKDMIATADVSIAQVALAVGYSDQAHFTRAFKLLTGLTPQEYRQLRRPLALVAAE